MNLRKVTGSQGIWRFPWKLMQYIIKKLMIGVTLELLKNDFQLPHVNADLVDCSLFSGTSSLFQLYSASLSTFQDCFKVWLVSCKSLLSTPRGECYPLYSRYKCAQPIHSLLSLAPVIADVSCINTPFKDCSFDLQDKWGRASLGINRWNFCVVHTWKK